MRARSLTRVFWTACGLIVVFFVSVSGRGASQEDALSARQVIDNIAAKKYSGRRIDLVSSNAGLQEVMAQLEKAVGMHLDLDPSINDRVTYRLIDVPWDEALAAVLADNALHISLNLEGTGFKIGRGKPVVLALSDRGRAKFILFLYRYLFHIAGALVILSAAAAGLILFRRNRTRKRAIVKKALLPPEAVEKVKSELVHLLKDGRLYRDEDLTLPSLAEKLAVSPHQLSWIINEELHVSFPSLVNGYRVEEVKSRLADPANDGASILKIALDAGFNTKASFNRAFRKFTGMNPSQYKKSLPRQV
ncbi:MAG: helix-turn-helix domain-containing protein [Candidatus Aminicenantes bacterium]|nr:helix-turn-helix domain-containing protein [Candidatus Aminicenantes bacterium]